MKVHYRHTFLEALVTTPSEALLIAQPNMSHGDEVRLVDVSSPDSHLLSSARYTITRLSLMQGKKAIRELLGESLPFVSANTLGNLTPYEREFVIRIMPSSWYTIASISAVPDAALKTQYEQ